MGSERLPGKVLAPICDRPMLAWQLLRLQSSRRASVVLATTQEAEDDPVADLADRLGVPCVRGSTDDLMSRHLAAATFTGADVVGICGADDPLLNGALFDLAFERFAQGDVEYVRTVGWPLGLAVHVVSTAGLTEAFRDATDPIDRAEVVSWWQRQHRPSADIPAPDPERRDYRLTVDEAPDLALHRVIFERLGWNCSIPDVCAFLDAKPALAAMNRGIAQRWTW